MFPNGETVTRQRPTLVSDRYSNAGTKLDWDNPDELEIPGCAFDPGSSNEPTEQARNAVVTQPTVYDPSYADVQAGDRVIVRGKTYEVDGDPADFRSPFTGWAPGQVIALRRKDG